MSNCQCVGRVWGNYRYTKCGKGAAYEHEGAMYCKTHHPPTVEAKQAVRLQALIDKNNSRRAAEKLEAQKAADKQRMADAFPDLLQSLQLVAAHIPEIIAAGILTAAETDTIRAAITKAGG